MKGVLLSKDGGPISSGVMNARQGVGRAREPGFEVLGDTVVDLDGVREDGVIREYQGIKGKGGLVTRNNSGDDALQFTNTTKVFNLP
jgi:hypothetical protein